MRVNIFKRILLAFEIGAIIAVLYIGARLWSVQARLQRDLERAQAAEAAISGEEAVPSTAAGAAPSLVRRLVLPTISLEADLEATRSSTPERLSAGPVLISALPDEPADLVPLDATGDRSGGALAAAARLSYGDAILLVEGETTRRYSVTASRPAMGGDVRAVARTSRADLALIIPDDTLSDTERIIILATLERDGAN